MTVVSHGSSTHLIIDVTGYYVPQIASLIQPDLTIYAGTTRVVSVVRNSTGQYQVTMDTDVSYRVPTATTYSGANGDANALAFNGTSIKVYLWTLNGSVVEPTDFPFHLRVSC